MLESCVEVRSDITKGRAAELNWNRFGSPAILDSNNPLDHKLMGLLSRLDAEVSHILGHNGSGV